MLHPIRALDHVIDSYRDYLTTEFRARDPQLRQALEDALDRAGFLAQEPFFSAHRPFPQQQRWADLPLDSKLAAAISQRSRSDTAFLHQSQAIDYLLGAEAGPLVVTTGTGSGKTEAFLAPVLQAAIEDATQHRGQPGLVALILYPMNALANDQFERIQEYLQNSGWAGSVDVQMYNRSTTEAERAAMRQSPPHILLTNYQMLEYLLVRPKDRDSLFANHRLRFLVFDEVHTYRGTLGTHVALLIRRLKAHLRRSVPGSSAPICVGTSATIKSDDPSAPRDRAVQFFFGRLVGEIPDRVVVIGESKIDLNIPIDARYSSAPYAALPDLDDPAAIRRAVAALSDAADDTPLAEAARRARILWDLNDWLSAGPQSLSELIDRVAQQPERAGWDRATLEREVVTALRIGAALPEGTPAALRLRTHRLVRGGWEFHRCLNPDCGALYPKGEEQCARCGTPTAPLYLCRNCGADFWRMAGSSEGVGELKPFVEANRYAPDNDVVPNEWLLYRPERWKDEGFEAEDDETVIAEEVEDYQTEPKRGKSSTARLLQIAGSFDPATLNFNSDPQALPQPASLYNSRKKCPGCGSSGGPRPIITRVSLGTSAAVKVLSEGLMEALPIDQSSDDHKQRLLVFADSRQDAAHQARFVRFASRYDRMRQRVVSILRDKGPLSLQRVVEELARLGIEHKDSQHLPKVGYPRGEDLLKVQAYEEAPLLDDLAVNTRYRATLENLGLIVVRYADLSDFMQAHGPALAESFHLPLDQVEYLVTQLLDTFRRSGVLHRDLLRHHPDGVTKQSITLAADWERRLRNPAGLPVGEDGYPALQHADGDLPPGVLVKPIWGKGHAQASPQKVLTLLLDRLNGTAPDLDAVRQLLHSLADFGYLKRDSLHGTRGRPIELFQVNDAMVILALAVDGQRARCDTCTRVVPGGPIGLPCPRCDKGALRAFTDAEVQRSRYAKRALNPASSPLVAEEHTAQITPHRRKQIEDDFKSKTAPTNFLACSPTLELGIDVGQLDSVVMRNVPPRPDNYAQRGGRAGRRSRVGLVLGYTRATPHDQYFFDHPAEMIAGEVPAPAFGLGNRDAILRHVNAIACGLADPGLAGRMAEYVTFMGDVVSDNVEALLAGVQAALPQAVEIAVDAFGLDALTEAGYTRADLRAALEQLPGRIREAIERTGVQVKKLHSSMDAAYLTGQQGRVATRAMDMINKLLGIPTDQNRTDESSDAGSAYPLRRLAEFGLLPGYEFPVQPATLRLLGDEDEWSTLSTARAAGLRQYEPGAPVYARGRRWKVFGIDLSSPWNPQGQGKSVAWYYQRCDSCGLIFDPPMNPRCPRCGHIYAAKALPAYAYAGFLARQDESIVADEEDRIANADRVQIHPSWQAEQIVGKWRLPEGWRLELRRGELVRWLNEGALKDPTNKQSPRTYYMFCPQCGKLLTPPDDGPKGKKKTSKAPARGSREDVFGHAQACPLKGQPGEVGALFAEDRVETLRLFFPWAGAPDQEQALTSWAVTLGEALLAGAERHFALSANDLNALWEGTHEVKVGETVTRQGVLTFIDPNIGGSGYLRKLVEELPQVARAALEHLDHDGCDTACYRCLKTYLNQRWHSVLRWPVVTSTLAGLAEVAPEPRPLDTIDLNDPAPWAQAFAAGCASPLEYRCLQLLENAGYAPAKQYPINDGGLPFTVADFAFPDRRVAIYVDGLAFHTGSRLRRDRAIEERLQNMVHPWKILRFTARDVYHNQDSLLAQVESALAR
jgi:ATP-dependent helicase YprA (DUF1998 family)